MLGPEILVRRMCECARESLARYTDEDLDRFGFEAGMAIEMAAKAILASQHLSLIVDARSVDSLFQAAGIRSGTAPPGRLRTISCEEALRRVVHLHDELKGLQPKLSLLVECRDGYVHLGAGDESTARSVLPAYAEALFVMGHHLGLADEAIFGAYAELAHSVWTDAAESVRTRVLAQVARAGEEYRQAYGHLDPKVRHALVKAVEAMYRPAKYEEGLVGCPACENLAVLSGTFEIGDEVDSYDDEGNPDGAHLNVTLHGHALSWGYASCI